MGVSRTAHHPMIYHPYTTLEKYQYITPLFHISPRRRSVHQCMDPTLHVINSLPPSRPHEKFLNPLHPHNIHALGPFVITINTLATIPSSRQAIKMALFFLFVNLARRTLPRRRLTPRLSHRGLGIPWTASRSCRAEAKSPRPLRSSAPLSV